MSAEGNEQIAVVPLAGGAPRIIDALHFYGTNFPFDVSRDGTRLVTSNSQHLSDEIWLLDAAQTQRK